MKIGIIPYTYFGGVRRAVGSTKLRVDSLVKQSNDYEIWKHGHSYDCLIFQKVYWTEMMECFTGPKILDLCDPDWLKGEFDLIETGNMVDAITCSSDALTKLIKSYFPKKIVEHVPDRLNFTEYSELRPPHVGKAKTAAWFGFIHNAQEMLPPLIASLKKYNLKLLIIADKPYDNNTLEGIDVEYFQYDPETIHSILIKSDLVLNPKSYRAEFKYKSNNKSIISWKLGLPVAENNIDIKRLMDGDQRNLEVLAKQRLLEADYNIIDSVKQYLDIVRRITLKK